jgi:oligopeptide transport system substrate-binding protein
MDHSEWTSWTITAQENTCPSTSIVEPFSLYPTFLPGLELLKKWTARFPFYADVAIYTDFCLLHLLAEEKYLSRHTPQLLFRLSLSLHFMQKELVHSATCTPNQRHFAIRWISSYAQVAGVSQPVLGCLVGFSVLDTQEHFDESLILQSLQNHQPCVRLVESSVYTHSSKNKNLRVFYFEIAHKYESIRSFSIREEIKNAVRKTIRKSILSIVPAVFIKLNEEEYYKQILMLSQEIRTPHDVPQVHLSLEQQKDKEIVFRVVMVYVQPSKNFSLKKCFFNCTFLLERVSIVKHIANHPVEACVFCLQIPRDASLLRSNGSLHFYLARQKIVHLIQSAIGEFRDYNGGIIVQQQELLESFAQACKNLGTDDPELIETFFYAITPPLQQILLSVSVLTDWFHYSAQYFSQQWKEDLHYILRYSFEGPQQYLVVAANHDSIKAVVADIWQQFFSSSQNTAHAYLDQQETHLFCCLFLNHDENIQKEFLSEVTKALERWYLKRKYHRTLRIAMDYPIISLDPRIGGDTTSSDLLKLLFEGLTRFDPQGNVENALAESIQISADLKEYTFTLRPSLWNDGSPVTAHDFEYAWKKILSPNFDTAFAYHLYSIKNAKEAKGGLVPINEIGCRALDDRTLQVKLIRPITYFLEITALPICSPVHRFVDEQCPEWSTLHGKSYPCNGPFQLRVNQPHQGYQLVRNASYWDTKYVALDQISMTFMSPAHALQAFRKKELDWIGNPLGDWHPFFHHGNEEKIITFRNWGVHHCVFNTSCFPFHSSKLRRAFAYAIQRSQIVKKAFLPLTPAYSPLLPHLPETTDVLFPEYNPEEAKRLFCEALSELGQTNLPPIKLLCSGKGVREHIAASLKQQFEECFGVTCVLQPLPRHLFFQAITGGGFQIAIQLWTSLLDTPAYTLNIFTSSQNKVNGSRWEHPAFQQALDEREEAASPYLRVKALRKAEEILCQEAPIIPLCYQPAQALVRKELQINHCFPGGHFNLGKSHYQKELCL